MPGMYAGGGGAIVTFWLFLHWATHSIWSRNAFLCTSLSRGHGKKENLKRMHFRKELDLVFVIVEFPQNCDLTNVTRAWLVVVVVLSFGR